MPACVAPPALNFPIQRSLKSGLSTGAAAEQNSTAQRRGCAPGSTDCIPPAFLDFESPVHAMDGFWVFSARRAGEAHHQVYLLKDAAPPVAAPTLPTAFESAKVFPGMPENADNRTPFITGDAVILVYSSNRTGSRERVNASRESAPSYDLYWTAIVQGEWARHAPLSSSINTAEDESCPSLSNDRKHLYFTRRSGPGAPGILYAATFENGTFQNATALPAPINPDATVTAANAANADDPEAPRVGENRIDNDCLRPVDNEGGFLFQSNRGNTRGGMDIFFVSFRRGKWGVPVPAAPDFNSDAYDGEPWYAGGLVYFTRENPGTRPPQTARLASAGSASKGTLPAFARPNSRMPEQNRRRRITGRKALAPVYNIRFRVENAATHDGVPATLQIDAGSGLGAGELGFARVEFKTDDQGSIAIPVSPSLDTLQITITEPAYLPHFQTIDVAQAAAAPITIALRAVKKKESFDLHAIHFEYNSATLTEDSFPLLDSLSEYMKKNPTVRFEIIGHTDLTGSQSFNARLSLRRAESVKDYLVSRGIEAARFAVTGKGKLQPLQKERSAAADQLNRRTEFKIMDD